MLEHIYFFTKLFLDTFWKPKKLLGALIQKLAEYTTFELFA